MCALQGTYITTLKQCFRSESSISSAAPNSFAKKIANGSFWTLSKGSYIFLFPWIKLGQFFCFLGRFLRECLFCCFHFIPPPNALDWEDTLESFQKIREIISLPKNKIGAEQKKEFYLILKKLSPAALYRFEQHLVFVYLKDPKKSIINGNILENPILDRVEQEKWFNENRKEIDFDRVFYQQMDNNKVLQVAIEQFYQELQRNT